MLFRYIYNINYFYIVLIIYLFPMQGTTKMTSPVNTTLQKSQDDDNLASLIDCDNRLPGSNHGSLPDTDQRSIRLGPIRQSKLEFGGLEPGEKLSSSFNGFIIHIFTDDFSHSVL